LFGQTGSSLEGQVVNAVTGAPLKRATVTLQLTRILPMTVGQPARASGSNTVETDDQGRFAFREVAPGGYAIRAQRQGFLDPAGGQVLVRNALMVGENQQITGIVVRLAPYSVISGKVLDSDGEPLAGVRVVALRWGFGQLAGQLTRTVTESPFSTNDLGEYRIAGLPAGGYFVAAEAPRRNGLYSSPRQPLEDKPEVVYTPTYYPAVTDAAAATPVKVAAGAETRGIDIKMVEVKAFSIRGRVIDPEAPATGALASRMASVSLRPRAIGGPLNYFGYGVRFSDGGFHLSGVPPGSYYLVAQRVSEQGHPAAGGSLPIDVGDKNLDGIAVQALPVVDVDVVTKAEPAGPSNCGVFVSLVDGVFSGGVPGVNAPPGSKTALKNVVPGAYALHLGAGQCYVQSVRFGGRDVTDMRLKVDGSGPLEITLAASDATVEGTVADAAGKPVLLAAVALVPKDGPQTDYRTYSTTRNGAFTISGLRPGAYDVLAWENVDYSAAQSLEYAKQFESRATSITVRASGRQTLHLTAIPASATGEPVPAPAVVAAKGSVEGQVVHALTGAPLSGVKITLGTRPVVRSTSGAPGSATGVAGSVGGQMAAPEETVETDPQGRFAFRSVEPDFYYLSAELRGFDVAAPPVRAGAISQQIVVGNGQRIAGYTIKLAPQGVVAGRVTDEFGEAVGNAQAWLFRADRSLGPQRLLRLAAAQTDDLGKFRLSGLAPGSYYLAVLRRTLGRPSPVAQAPASEPETGYGITWYPNAPDVASASAIAVGAGAEVPVEMVLRRTKFVHIRGTVVDEAGNPVERPTVELTPRGLGTSVASGNVRMEPGGAFEITSVPAGFYMLFARVGSNVAGLNGGAPPRMAYLHVEVRDSSLEGVQLRLTAGKEVRVAVSWDGGGRPAPIVDATATEGVLAFASTSTSNGAFTLRPIWPLTYTLDVRGLCANCYVKSMRYGGHDVPEAGIEFDGDGELEIAVSASAASLDGVAVDRQGRPAAGATVILAPADGAGKILSGKADARGAFHFGGLRPGAYRVSAWEGAAPDASPEAIAPFQAQATAVKLAENAKETLRIATIAR
jgi:hypothetical protein